MAFETFDPQNIPPLKNGTQNQNSYKPKPNTYTYYKNIYYIYLSIYYYYYISYVELTEKSANGSLC